MAQLAPSGTSTKSKVCKKIKVEQGHLGSLKGITSKPPRFTIPFYSKPSKVSDGKALMHKEFAKVRP